MMKRVWKITVFLLLIIVAGASIVAGVVTIFPKSTVQDLRVEVWTDKKTYGVNENITIHLKIVNPTLSQIILHFNSAFQFDYIIFDQANNQLYQWSSNKRFAQMLTEIRVSPLNSYEKTFDYTSYHPLYPLQPETYTIRGVVVGYFSENTTVKISGT